MRVTELIHALRIPFQIALPSGAQMDRFVYAFLIFGQKITLIDTGVAGAEEAIFQYVRKAGRNPAEIAWAVLTHAHPDHIGSARRIREAVGCRIAIHAAEREWIEDVEKQVRERPVPGFHTLVAGSAPVDRALADGEIIDTDDETRLQVIHTPGHSAGSISLWFGRDGALFCGDAVPAPGGLPVYDDAVVSSQSLRKLMRRASAGAAALLSSWDDPRVEGGLICQAINDGFGELRRVHKAVMRAAHEVREAAGNKEDKGSQGARDSQKAEESAQDAMDALDAPELALRICPAVVKDLGLPPAAANPITARTIAAHLRAPRLDEILRAG